MEEFRKLIQVRSPNTVYRYLRGERCPRPKIAARIERVTGGAVTLADLYAAYSAARPPAKSKPSRRPPAKSRGTAREGRARG